MRVRPVAALLLGLLRAVPAMGASEPAAFAAAAVDELRALSSGWTPAAWLAAHPDDELERVELRLWRQRDLDVGQWCARARRREARRGGVRDAYFYVPEPPSPARLPADDEAAELVMTRCQLGLIRVEAAEPDTPAGEAAALALREALSRAYGRDAATTPMSLFGSGLVFGSAWFRSMSHWRVGELHVLSAYRRPPDDTGRGYIFATAALPISGQAGWRRRGTAGDLDARSADEDVIVKAVAVTGLDSIRAEPLRQALRWVNDAHRARSPSQWPANPPDLVSIITRWLGAVPSWHTRGRAGALLVAHVLLSAAGGLDAARPPRTGIHSTWGRLRLWLHGARFVQPLKDEGPPIYAGNWLRDAWSLDDGGPVGDLALPLLLGNACGCPTGKDCFLWAISEGERFLSRPHDRQVLAKVHLLVALAYRHGVALGEGATCGIGGERSRGEADTYRAKAISHYRAWLAAGPSADAVEEHWRDAWRLLARLPPIGTAFSCGC